MRLLLDSFWRAVAYCMLPRVIVLSLLPLGLMVLLASVLGYFYWDAAVVWTRGALDAWPLLASFWAWIGRLFSSDVTALLAPLVVVFAATPLVVVLSLLIVAGFMAPALTKLVAERRFPSLEQKKGASFIGSVARSLGVTPEERAALLRAHRLPLLLIGVLCGYLGAAPSIVWASGLLFAAAFFVLVPIAIWIYTLVFAFSALWFAHYCLDALGQLRAQRAVAEASAASSATGGTAAIEVSEANKAALSQWGSP
jgi:hypothetical protein